ncbi:unnamed protein product [Onchocerca flexuosa]|uniref:Aminotran_1_2 domain-containing protein n=1 Tax=Onchocerca flexuosa TaxID=387005 RepID=A0A183I020_9BILA|nr:unnamed protein product [Onchocerca flexuosa]
MLERRTSSTNKSLLSPDSLAADVAGQVWTNKISNLVCISLIRPLEEVEKFGKDLGVVRLGWRLGCWIDCARVYIGLIRPIDSYYNAYPAGSMIAC